MVKLTVKTKEKVSYADGGTCEVEYYEGARTCCECGKTYALLVCKNDCVEYYNENGFIDFSPHSCYHCGFSNPTYIDSYGSLWNNFYEPHMDVHWNHYEALAKVVDPRDDNDVTISVENNYKLLEELLRIIKRILEQRG